MFGVGKPVWYNPEAVYSALTRTIKSPDHVWIPISPTPQQVKDPRSVPYWTRAFPKASSETILPKREDFEALVSAYLQMGHWDFAFLLCVLVYWGNYTVPSMDSFLWEGPPGVSRLWVARGAVMIPLPSGPVRTALETWWALSGGYLNTSRRMLPVDPTEFESHWYSIDSPVILVRPWGTDDPSEALEKIKIMHQNEMAYPMTNLTGRQDLDCEERDGVYWYKGGPIGTVRKHPPTKQSQDMCLNGPLGLRWLEAAKDTIPPKIYRLAKSLRESGYVRP